MISEDPTCYFIKNIVNQINCLGTNLVSGNSSGEATYPRKLLLKMILMSIFDEKLSYHIIKQRTRMDITYNRKNN